MDVPGSGNHPLTCDILFHGTRLHLQQYYALTAVIALPLSVLPLRGVMW